MKKTLISMLMLCALTPVAMAQTSADKTASVISVSGKSDMSITPDEVHLLLTEKEYYLIDFKGKIFIDYKDYSSGIEFNQSLFDSTLPDAKFQFTVNNKVYEAKKKDIKYTLVNIATLEDRVIKAAEKAGISKSDITISELGDYWRWRNGAYMVSKQYDLKLTDPAQFNKFISSLDKQGVSSLSFGEMKNNDMERYDREGRIKALENAKDKATYMVQTYGGNLGIPLEISDGSVPVVTMPVMARSMALKAANGVMMDEEAATTDSGAPSLESLDTFPKISKTYTVNVTFTANY